MHYFSGIDALAAEIDTHLGYSEWQCIDQPGVAAFAEATGDAQWIHVDPERAAAGPFGTTIAHGYLVLSLIPLLTRQVFRVDGLALEVNYGLNKVRFPAPTLVPARVRAGMHLVSLTPQGEASLATLRVTMESAGGSKPLCVAEVLSYLVPE